MSEIDTSVHLHWQVCGLLDDVYYANIYCLFILFLLFHLNNYYNFFLIFKISLLFRVLLDLDLYF